MIQEIYNAVDIPLVQQNELNSIYKNIRSKPQYQIPVNQISGELLIFELDISLTFQKIKQERIRIPIVHAQCQDNYRCYDLLDLYQKLNQQNQYKCQWCNTQLTKNDLTINFQISELHQQIVQQLNVFTSKVLFFKKLNQVTLIYSENTRKKLIDDPNLRNIFEAQYKNGQQSSQFNINHLISQNKPKNQTEYYCLCAFDSIKIKIPIRNRNCQHLEAFDITSILLRLQNSYQLKQEECPIEKCNSLFIWDEQRIKEDFGVDIDLLKEINLGLSSQNEFSLKDKISHYTLEDLEKQQFYQQLWNEFGPRLMAINQKVTLQKYIIKIQKDLNIILEKPIDQTIQQANEKYKYTNYPIDLNDPVTKLGVRYLGKCKYCVDHRKAIDLRSLIMNLIFETEKTQKDENEENKFSCPLCECKFTYDLLDQSHLILFQFYNDFDPDLQRQILYQPQSKEYKQILYDGKNRLLKMYQKQNRITRADYGQEFAQQQNIQFPSTYCKIGGQILEHPLKLKQCSHKQYISFNQFYSKYENNQLNFQICQKCPPITKLEDLQYDCLLSEILKNKNINEQNCSVKVNRLYPLKIEVTVLQENNLNLIQKKKTYLNCNLNRLKIIYELEPIKSFQEKQLIY